MNETDALNYQLHEAYCYTGPNEVKFISDRQTMSVVLGSCISTVFIGKHDKYILGANHIVIAEPSHGSIVAKKSAIQQIDEILDVYNQIFKLKTDSIRCLHIIGSGKKISGDNFSVHTDNISAVKKILNEKEFVPVFNDTNSHFFASYSIAGNNLSVSIENKISLTHISVTINLDKLFELDQDDYLLLPAAMLENNEAFESLVSKEVISFITGKKNR